MNNSFLFFSFFFSNKRIFFMLFLLRCFHGILFYFTCVGYFNPTYLGTLIHHSYGKKTVITSSFVANAFIFFSHVCSCTSLSKGYIWFFIHSLFFFLFFFFFGSKLNLITAFEVFFLLCSFLCFFFWLQRNVLLYM